MRHSNEFGRGKGGSLTMSRSVLERINSRGEERARRLQLLGATWEAGGADDPTAITTVSSELKGLAKELDSTGLSGLAEAVQAGADALSSYRAANRLPELPHEGRRILILDENEVTRDVVAVSLEGVGCLVTMASSLKECLERFKEFEPEVILMEPAHRELQREGACTALRAQLKSAVVPIVLFSADPPQRLAKRAEALGADGYVSKDQGVQQLLEQLHRVLSSVVW